MATDRLRARHSTSLLRWHARQGSDRRRVRTGSGRAAGVCTPSARSRPGRCWSPPARPRSWQLTSRRRLRSILERRVDAGGSSSCEAVNDPKHWCPIIHFTPPPASRPGGDLFVAPASGRPGQAASPENASSRADEPQRVLAGREFEFVIQSRMNLRLVSSSDDGALAIRDHLLPLVRDRGMLECQPAPCA